MASVIKASVMRLGEDQCVVLPEEYRFDVDEVFVRCEPSSGDWVLSRAPGSWSELFAALGKDPFPREFMADRAQGIVDVREDGV